MPGTNKARVFRNSRSQALSIPAENCFTTDQGYISRDQMAEIFTKFDKAGATEFVLERDLSLPSVTELP